MSPMTAKDALLEIGCEELPASFIPLGLKQLKTIAEASLAAEHLAFTSTAVYGTPRRLAICITGVVGHSADQRKKVLGPPLASARDADGRWSPAAAGFARKQGLTPEELVTEEGRLCAVHEVKGVAARSLLATLYPQWIARLDFPKAMVWEPTHFRFPRPIRWFAALYGQDLVSFSLAGVRSGRWTQGLSAQSSKKVLISHAGKYVTLLKNQCVIVDPAVRRDVIRRLAEQAVRRIQGQVLIDDSLLEQVADLVEHPVAIVGNFDPAYLQLPQEVLITCMQHHQKFFPVRAASEGGKLLPCFVGMRNGVSVHQEIVKEGYERVLSARLADARFFYNQDRKSPLAAKVDALRGVTFQKDLGSLFDKKERTKVLLEAIMQRLTWPEPERQMALRTAELCKADLVTDMVREFPELQGIVARLYAQADAEPALVSDALQEHYWPLTLSGGLPRSPIGSIVSLADKLDTLVGDFAVGLIPSGSADPYGLRRAAVGILRILEANASWTLPVEWLVDQALTALPASVTAQRDKTRQELIQFIRQRLAAVLEERGFKFDEIEAVLALQLGSLPEALARLNALHDIRARQEFGPLSAAFKRAVNIVRQANQKEMVAPLTHPGDHAVQSELLQDPSEQSLYKTYQDIHQDVDRHLQAGSYSKALESMVPLRDPLDRFFDGVMVMVEDTSLRSNRLALLSGIVRLFLKVADFSKLQNA